MILVELPVLWMKESDKDEVNLSALGIEGLDNGTEIGKIVLDLDYMVGFSQGTQENKNHTTIRYAEDDGYNIVMPYDDFCAMVEELCGTKINRWKKK